MMTIVGTIRGKVKNWIFVVPSTLGGGEGGLVYFVCQNPSLYKPSLNNDGDNYKRMQRMTIART